ncbi:MAG: ABC transporter permease [Lachnospiraceae bacterium]
MKEVASKFWNQRKLQLMAWMGIIWMIVFCYIPMGGIVIAFKQYKITKPISEAAWVGLQNFKDFFANEDFWNIIINTLGISVLKLVIGFPLPIIFALLLNEIKNTKFKKFVQTASYLPHFISWVVLGGILITWLDANGVINDLLVGLGITSSRVYYLGKPQYFWWLALISDSWKELGWNAIIYLAAISGIDQQMYEAATVDGASKLKKILYITLPSIKGTIAILFVLAVAGMMNSNFDQIFMLKNVLNAERSTVIDIHVYEMGMRAGRYSYATAVGLFKSVIAMILLLTANKTTKKLTGNSLY